MSTHKTKIAGSPMILKFSPEQLSGRDASFEAYKQPKNKSKRRSFSPMFHENSIPSPNLSPIELNQTFCISPRNHNRIHRDTNGGPAGYLGNKSLLIAKKKAGGPENRSSPLQTTPLIKRELEHRICMSNILKDMDLSKYIRIFNREEINFDVFLTLSEKDLHDIGIHCQEDVEKILAKIADYSTNA